MISDSGCEQHKVRPPQRPPKSRHTLILCNNLSINYSIWCFINVMQPVRQQ